MYTNSIVYTNVRPFSNSTLFQEIRSSFDKGAHHSDYVCLFLAGEFIKYHDLKENDAMLLYEDASGKLVSLNFLS